MISDKWYLWSAFRFVICLVVSVISQGKQSQVVWAESNRQSVLLSKQFLTPPTNTFVLNPTINEQTNQIGALFWLVLFLPIFLPSWTVPTTQSDVPAEGNHFYSFVYDDSLSEWSASNDDSLNSSGSKCDDGFSFPRGIPTAQSSHEHCTQCRIVMGWSFRSFEQEQQQQWIESTSTFEGWRWKNTFRASQKDSRKNHKSTLFYAHIPERRTDNKKSSDYRKCNGQSQLVHRSENRI